MYSRREMLRCLAGGSGMLGLAAALSRDSSHAEILTESREPHLVPRAKRVIFLFLHGGPCHIDLFDRKPALANWEGKPVPKNPTGRERGAYRPSPFRFKKYGESGLELSQILPRLSKLADDLCVVRSMFTDVPNHEPAMLQMNTGAVQPERPSVGAWVQYGLGTENENLPGYVVLRTNRGGSISPTQWASRFLPSECQGTYVAAGDMKVDNLLKNIRNGRFTMDEQREQLDLLEELNREHLLQHSGDAILEGEIHAMERAYRMQAEATDAFDIFREPRSVRRRYGDSKFGQSCLLARRLAERGVRFTTVYHTTERSGAPWDTHSHHDQLHEEAGRDADRAAAALIEDLKRRGMLGETLVLFGGEFGRTPFTSSVGGRGGRDHHASAFSMMMAGGGVRPGTTYGETDELGMEVVRDPVSTHDLHATVLHLLGIDHRRLLYHQGGRVFYPVVEPGKVVKGIVG